MQYMMQIIFTIVKMRSAIFKTRACHVDRQGGNICKIVYKKVNTSKAELSRIANWERASPVGQPSRARLKQR